MVYATGLHCLFIIYSLGASYVYDGITLAAELFFMYATMLIAVPTGVKVFNWVATIFKGRLTFETPMLFAIAFVFLFTIGGFSGLMLSMFLQIFNIMILILWSHIFIMF